MTIDHPIIILLNESRHKTVFVYKWFENLICEACYYVKELPNFTFGE